VALAACGGGEKPPPTNGAPSALDDLAEIDEDTALVIRGASLASNDVDAEGDTLTVTSVGAATHGSVTLVDGTVTFTPEVDFSGAATFEYSVGDGRLTDTGMVRVRVNPVHDAPTAVADALSTPEDSVLSIPGTLLLANDTDVDGDSLRVAFVGTPTHGTVELANGDVTYWPDANFAGTATFEYTVIDGTYASTAMVTVTVDPVEDTPSAVEDSASMDEDSVLVIPTATLLANDTDGDGDTLWVAGVGTATHGTVTLAGGTVTFTPEANYFGDASFEYTVSDGLKTSTATMGITVNSVSDTPVAIADALATQKNTGLTIKRDTLTANDVNVDGGLLMLAGVGTAAYCTVKIDGGEIFFTPESNFTGAATFQYTVRNWTGGTSTATVTVTVSEAPVAVADTASTDEDTVLVIASATLLANDIDVDSDNLVVVEVRTGTHGTVTLAGGNVTFTPETNFFGTATFEYRVSDGGSTSTATVTVTVNSVNDAPVAVADSAVASGDVEQRIPVATLLFNDSDLEGDSLTVSQVANAHNGTVELDGEDVRFTPTPGFVGAASFEYQVSDLHGATATGSVAVRVRDYSLTSLFAGQNRTCAVFADGRVKCWGANSVGQLGLEDSENRGGGFGNHQMGSGLPFVRLGTGQRVTTLGLGGSSTCALLEGGSVKCWGGNASGQLGLGDMAHRGDGPGEMGDSLPPVFLGTGRSAKAVAGGLDHTCAILENGEVKCWGSNQHGQLGLGDMEHRGDGPGEMGDALPLVNLGTGRTAKALAAGGIHTCALLDDGSVKCWGGNYWAQLGLGDREHRGDGPGELGDALPSVDLGTGRTAKALATRENSTCALLDDNSVKCWGINQYGALGLGDREDRGDEPGEMGDALPPVDLGTGRTAMALTVGGIHACALLDDGSIKCWGGNYRGQLGLGDMEPHGGVPGEMGDALPRVNLGTGRAVKSLTAGSLHTCATFDEGSVKCWGSNTVGQLGLDDTDHRGDFPGEMGDALPAVEL